MPGTSWAPSTLAVIHIKLLFITLCISVSNACRSHVMDIEATDQRDLDVDICEKPVSVKHHPGPSGDTEMKLPLTDSPNTEKLLRTRLPGVE